MDTYFIGGIKKGKVNKYPVMLDRAQNYSSSFSK